MAKPSAKKRVKRSPEERREQILDGAARAFMAKGTSAATMSDIASEAGVAHGTVYLYFDSKEQLLAGLGDRYTEELIRRSGDWLDGDRPEDFVERLDRFLEETTDFHFEEHELQRLLFHAGAVSEAESMRKLLEMLKRFIEGGVEAGRFRVSDTRFAADFLLHGLHGALVQILHEHGPERGRFLTPAKELAHRTLGTRTRASEHRK
jgi:TetR/AcrR family transcriptional repressor of nem operon